MSKLVPELLVSDLHASLAFWVDLLDFKILYDRPAERFAYLRQGSIELMLEEMGHGRNWVADELQKPYGRGINFQMEADDWSMTVAKLNAQNWPLYLAPEDKWYRVGDVEKGQRQFLVQDPDGYLLRLAQPIGERMAQ